MESIFNFSVFIPLWLLISLVYLLVFKVLFWWVFFFSVNIRGDEPYLVSGAQTLLHVESLGHVLRAFVNGRLVGKFL